MVTVVPAWVIVPDTSTVGASRMFTKKKNNKDYLMVTVINSFIYITTLNMCNVQWISDSHARVSITVII